MIKEIYNTRYEVLLLWLKDARNRQGLSIRDLARLIDEPYQFVSKVERGERRLNVYEYAQYCRALNLDPSDGIKVLEKR
jgi:transcriptional regulator with XRE-family HTH domain